MLLAEPSRHEEVAWTCFNDLLLSSAFRCRASPSFCSPRRRDRVVCSVRRTSLHLRASVSTLGLRGSAALRLASSALGIGDKLGLSFGSGLCGWLSFTARLGSICGTRKQVAALAQGYAAAFKARTDIKELGRKLRGIMRKIDAAVPKPNDRQRLADELSRLSGEAQWFADQVSKAQ
jgi:hypothetical protein